MTREEAIKIVKEFINDTCVDREALETLIPELKESEDERIRKEIVSALQFANDNGAYDKHLAWLEKQKDIINHYEEKLDRCVCENLDKGIKEVLNHPENYGLKKQKEQKSISAEAVLVKAGLKPYKDGNQWCVLAGDNIQEGICGFGDTIEDALYEFLKEVLDLQKKQQPAEWSEEDESHLKWLCGIIRNVRLHGGLSLKEESELAKWIDKWINHEPQPKNEWSEDDEHRCGDAIYFLETAKKHYADTSEIELTIDWLKSLRPQPKNEWSEDDKRMLNVAIKSCKQTIEDYPNDKVRFKDCIAWLKSLRPQSLARQARSGLEH